MAWPVAGAPPPPRAVLGGAGGGGSGPRPRRARPPPPRAPRFLRRGLLKLARAGSQPAPLYGRIFGAATLQDLPARPRFVINSTSLQSGVLWRFTKAYMEDYRVGRIPHPRTPLAVAVAASSAFPPF